MNSANDPAARQNYALSIHLREILRHPVFKPRAIVVLMALTAVV